MTLYVSSALHAGLMTLGALTERRNPKTADIDLAGALEIVDLINAEDRTVADAVREQRAPIAAALTAAEETLRSGGRLFYAGAGTSGRLGVLDASEISTDFRRAARSRAGNHCRWRGGSHALAGGRRRPSRRCP